MAVNSSSETKIRDEIRAVLKLVGLSDEEQGKVIADLEKAILTNFTRRVIDKLPERGDGSATSPEAALEYAKKHISEEESQVLLAMATEEVLSKFFKIMKELTNLEELATEARRLAGRL